MADSILEGQYLAPSEPPFFGFELVEPSDLGFKEAPVNSACGSPLGNLVSAATGACDAVRVEAGFGQVFVELNRSHVPSLFSIENALNIAAGESSTGEIANWFPKKRTVPQRDNPLSFLYNFGGAA